MNRGSARAASPDAEAEAVRVVVRTGKLILASGVASLAGLIATFSNVVAVAAWGWQVFVYGLLGVFVLGDYVTAAVAMRFWRRYRMVAWWLLFLMFLLFTFAVLATFVVTSPQLRDALYYSGILIFFIGLAVSVAEGRRRKREEAMRGT